MKVGLFWVCEPDTWMRQAADVLTSAAIPQELDVVCFSFQEVGHIRKINRRSDSWPYQVVNDLVDIHETATFSGMDFAVISFGRGIVCDLPKLQTLLVSPAVQRAVWSFRVSEISGVCMQNPPRLPFVDDHFIILNLRRAHEVEFFHRKLINASHFSHAGTRHAQLASMIEYSVLRGELNNHFIPETSRNQYGQLTKLNPMPFNLCETTGFVSCYPEFQPALSRLLERNLLRNSARLHAGLRFARRRGFWYLRFDPGFRRVVTTIRRMTHDISRYEFKKRYDQEPK